MSQQTDINSVLALVQRFARRFIRDHYDAQDLAQDVMVKVLVAEKRNPAIREWSDAQRAAWLLLITRRTAIDMVRKAKLYTLRNQELTDCHIAPGTIESHVETCEQIDAALSHVPDSQRVTLLLSAQGYTYGEIAEQEHLSQAGVKDRLYRARVAIREQVAA